MDAIKELLYSIGRFCADLLRRLIDWFMNLDLYNKILVVNTLTAFLAIVLPIAKYYIYESWFVINNPLAVNLILIVAVMIGTMFLRGRWIMPVRVGLNLWYLVYLIYIWGTHTISHAPYVISYGMFFNLAAPAVYSVIAVMIFLSE